VLGSTIERRHGRGESLESQNILKSPRESWTRADEDGPWARRMLGINEVAGRRKDDGEAGRYSGWTCKMRVGSGTRGKNTGFGVQQETEQATQGIARDVGTRLVKNDGTEASKVHKECGKYGGRLQQAGSTPRRYTVRGGWCIVLQEEARQGWNTGRQDEEQRSRGQTKKNAVEKRGKRWRAEAAREGIVQDAR